MSDASRHAELTRIFAAACACETEAERAAILDKLCGENAALRAEVESLLEHDVAPVVELDAGALEMQAVLALPREGLPERIGDYTILGLLGEGGMGVVYLAQQEEPRRMVALKVLRRSLATPALHARFRREAAALARLQHPAIAQIYATGTADDGQAFFALEYVKGHSLRTWTHEANASQRERVEMLINIAEGVQHAHDRGVLHRDLKPGNILIDESGRPKILDFGVARLVDDEAGATLATRTGQILGTVPYMSPEQITGGAARIDERSDVYALGVVAFELIAGRLPYDVGGASIADAARIIQDRPPDTLSTVVRDTRGDLETIIGKALEKTPDRRYHTIGALADDLRRYLGGRPILARPPSAVYLLRKMAMRHRALFVAGAIAVLALTAATVVSTVFAFREARARAAEAQRAEEADWQAYVANMAAIESALMVPDVASARQRLDAIAPEARERFEAQFYAVRFDGSQGVMDISLPRDSEGWSRTAARGYGIGSISWSPDGRLLAVGTTGRGVYVWAMDALAGRDLRDLPPPRQLAIENGAKRVMFAPVGEQLITVSRIGSVKAWRTDTWEVTWEGEIPNWEETAGIEPPRRRNSNWPMTWSDDGAWLAIGTNNGAVYVRDARSGEHRSDLVVSGEVVQAIDIMDDADAIVVAVVDGGVLTLDIDTGDVINRLPSVGRSSAACAISSDNQYLIGGGHDGLIHVWRQSDGGLETVLGGHASAIRSVVMTADSDYLLSTSTDRTARFWELATGQTVALMFGHTARIGCGAVSPRGTYLATGDADGKVRIWDVNGLRAQNTLQEIPEGARGIAASATGLIATAPFRGGAQLFDGATGARVASIPAMSSLLTVAFSPDGQTLAAGRFDGTVQMLDLKSGEFSEFQGVHDGLVTGLKVIDRNTWISASRDGRLHCGNRIDGSGWSVDVCDGPINAFAISPDGKTVVTGGADSLVHAWRIRDGSLLFTIDRHKGFIKGVAFTSAGTLITASSDGDIRFWSADGRPDGPPILLVGPIHGIVVSRATDRLVVRLGDRPMSLYDISHRSLVATIRDLKTAGAAVWSADGKAFYVVQNSLLVTLATESVADRQRALAEYETARAKATAIVDEAMDRAGGDLATARRAIELRTDLNDTEKRAVSHALLVVAIQRSAEAP